MPTWLPNSSVQMRCCFGKVLDELGSYSVSIMIGIRKKRVAFLVEAGKIEDFKRNQFYKKGALVEKKVLRNNRVWFSFDWVRLMHILREEGLC